MHTFILALFAALRLAEPNAQPLDTDDEMADAIGEASQADPIGHDVRMTAILLTVTAWQESRLSPYISGDSHASWGAWQVSPLSSGCSERELMVPATGAVCALAMLHQSFEVCSKHPIEERLAQYAYGRDCDHRLELSRHRMAMVRHLSREVQ